MMRRTLMLFIGIGLAMLGTGISWSEDGDQATLYQSLGWRQVDAVGRHRPGCQGYRGAIEAKYEMAGGKLMLSIYTSAKGFDTAAEDNSFNEYIGDVTSTTWAPKKEVFADLKHIARSAQYHALLSMTKVGIPVIIQKASAQGKILSVKEKIRGGKTRLRGDDGSGQYHQAGLLRSCYRRTNIQLRK